MTDPPAASEPRPSVAHLARRAVVGLLGLFAVVAVMGVVLREPLEQASAWFIATLGRPGLFIGVFLIDAVPFATHEPLLLLAHAGGVDFGVIFLVAGTASTLSGALGWAIGRAVGRAPWVHRLLERYGVAPLLRRHAVVAVALAATTPFPFAITTWGSGACGVRLDQVLLGALLRYPKVLFYLTIIVLGWGASA